MESESVRGQDSEISISDTAMDEISPNGGVNEFSLFGFGASETENVEYKQTLGETAHTKNKGSHDRALRSLYVRRAARDAEVGGDKKSSQSCHMKTTR